VRNCRNIFWLTRVTVTCLAWKDAKENRIKVRGNEAYRADRAVDHPAHQVGSRLGSGEKRRPHAQRDEDVRLQQVNAPDPLHPVLHEIGLSERFRGLNHEGRSITILREIERFIVYLLLFPQKLN
jgi:hypothetical protein